MLDIKDASSSEPPESQVAGSSELLSKAKLCNRPCGEEDFTLDVISISVSVSNS